MQPSTARLLELQRTAGNQSVHRLLGAVRSRRIQRVERERLWPQQLVRFGKKATVEPGAIEVAEGASGTVTAVPANGPVDVRLLGGPNADRTVKADPALLDLPAVDFKPEERDALWGWVWVVAPGVGVELVLKKGDVKEKKLEEGRAYARWVTGELERMGANPVGRGMLDQFDPARLGGAFKKVDKQDGPFRGLTVVIGAKDANIETTDMAGRTDTGGGVFKGTAIPRINLPMPRPGEKVPIPKSHPATLTEAGVAGHRDSPDVVQPMHLVLYHEFVHAYLKQIGVADRLRQLGNQMPGVPEKITKVRGVRPESVPEGDYSDAIEEELVVGLHGGAGLPFAENAYRCAGKIGPRFTYAAVGVDADKDLTDELQRKAAAAPPAIYDALIRLGANPKQAAFVATGKV